MSNTRKNLSKFAAGTLALSLATAFAATVPAGSAPNYDGLWSVVIITNKGTCDRAYRYPIRIAGGNVLNAGDQVVSITGRVTGNGTVTVRVSGGNKTALGQGRLSGASGAGNWTGGECSGVWQAEKRS